jgi:hypothetical protein
MCRVALWLGKICFMVHEADASRWQAHKERLGVPNAPLDRRLSVRAYRRSSPCNWVRLRRARIRLDSLFGELGLTRHPDKGCWEGAQVLEHLGVLIDTRQMRVFVTERTILRMRKMAKELLLRAQRNRRLVSIEEVRHFCGVAVSLTLAFPMARFYNMSLYWDMSLAWLRAGGDRGQSQREARSAGQAKRGPCGGPSVTLPERRSAQCGKWVSAPGDGELTWQHHRAPEPRRDKVRLSRQSLRDLAYWRSLTRGEGRDLHPPPADLTMHSDAADVGYSGTLGMESEAGSPGLWEGRGLWDTEERAEPITRELKAVRLLLQRHFSSFVAAAETKRILLQEDNQVVVHILNAMVSTSRPMMAELRRLEVMLRILRVKVEARWIPSAVNRYADALARQWDPGDVCATEALVESLCSAYEPDAVIFPYRPVGEHPVARRKYLEVQMGEDWGDGRARL